MALFSRVVAAVRQPSARAPTQFFANAKPAVGRVAAAPRHAAALLWRPAWGTKAPPPAVPPALVAPVHVQHGMFSRAPQLLAGVGAVLVDAASDGDSDATPIPGAFAALPCAFGLRGANGGLCSPCRLRAPRHTARHAATAAPPAAPLTCTPLPRRHGRRRHGGPSPRLRRCSSSRRRCHRRHRPEFSRGEVQRMR